MATKKLSPDLGCDLVVKLRLEELLELLLLLRRDVIFVPLREAQKRLQTRFPPPESCNEIEGSFNDIDNLNVMVCGT
jgi:hypothetical protein